MPAELIDAETRIGTNADGHFLHFTQTLPEDFLDNLKDVRDDAARRFAPDMAPLMQIPTFCFEVWQRQGRDPWKASARELRQWLVRDGLDAFIVTPKAF